LGEQAGQQQAFAYPARDGVRPLVGCDADG